MSRRGSQLALASLAAGSILICAGGGRGVEMASAPRREWPAGDARVALETIIGNRDGAKGFWRRLSGARAPEILRRPYDVAWDGEALLVTDPGAERVIRIEARGRIRMTRPDLVTGPIGVAVCDGGIVVTDSERGRVLLLNERLRLIRRLAEELERPTGVVCRGSTAFVVETGRHRVLAVSLMAAGDEAPSGFGSRGVGMGELNFPTAIALDAGKLWIGDTLNFRVQQYEIDSGSFLTAFGELGDAPGEMPRIKGLEVDRAGRLWVSDAAIDAVALHSRDGRFLMSLGRTGSGSGEFSFPAGIAAHPDGRVAVVDSLNRRVAIFRLLERDSDDRLEE